MTPDEKLAFARSFPVQIGVDLPGSVSMSWSPAARMGAGASPAGSLLTVPGLGCGQFAGPFHGQLGMRLQAVLQRLLTEYGGSFPNFRAVYFDLYSECENFFVGSRATDDGVKAAATNSMSVLTGVKGEYDPTRGKYQPPQP